MLSNFSIFRNLMQPLSLQIMKFFVHDGRERTPDIPIPRTARQPAPDAASYSPQKFIY